MHCSFSSFLRAVQELLTHSAEPDGSCSQLCIIHHWLIENISLWFSYSKRCCADWSVLYVSRCLFRVFHFKPVLPVLPSLERERSADWELHGHLYMSWDKQMRCKEQAMVRTVSKAFSALDTVWLYYAYNRSGSWIWYQQLSFAYI